MIPNVVAFSNEAVMLVSLIFVSGISFFCYHKSKDKFYYYLFFISVVFLVEHSIAHLVFEYVYSLSERDEARYLYVVWVILDLAAVMACVVYFQIRGVAFPFVLRMICLPLAINSVASILMQIDRNYWGLNNVATLGFLSPPNWRISDYWGLWDVYTYVVNANNVMIVLFMVFGVVSYKMSVFRKWIY